MPRNYNLIKNLIEIVVVIILYTILGILIAIIIDMIVYLSLCIMINIAKDNQLTKNIAAYSISISCPIIGGIIGCISGVLYINKIIKNE